MIRLTVEKLTVMLHVWSVLIRGILTLFSRPAQARLWSLVVELLLWEAAGHGLPG